MASMEQWNIFSVTSIIEHARSNNLPLAMTFIDLHNAFGCISHKLVQDMLYHLKIPACVNNYIADMYSHLSAFVSTKQWSTSSFPITRGLFQGDTMSPIIFLIAFTPIIQLTQSLSSPGFQFQIPVNSSTDLPTVGSTLYCE